MCEICRQDSRRTFAPSRRSFLLAASALLASGAALAKEDKKPPKPENVLSPDAALKRLLKGNERYVEGEFAPSRIQARAGGVGGRPKPLRRHSKLRRFADRARIRLR